MMDDLYQTENEQLRSQLQGLQAENEQLKCQLHGYKTEIGPLRSQLLVFQAENEQLKCHLHRLNEELKKKGKQNKDLVEENKELQQNHESILEDLTTLRSAREKEKAEQAQMLAMSPPAVKTVPAPPTSQETINQLEDDYVEVLTRKIHDRTRKEATISSLQDEMISMYQKAVEANTPQLQGRGAPPSLSGLFGISWGGCRYCDRLRSERDTLLRELQQTKAVNERLAQGVNADMKKYQGRDSMDIKKQYEDFFLSEFQDALPEADGVERDQAKTVLCMIFQAVYSYMKESVLAEVFKNLKALLKFTPAHFEDARFNDMKHAYVRLLSASGFLTGQPHPSLPTQEQLWHHVQQYIQFTSSQPDDAMKRYILGATQLAWSLLTAMPPLIPSCVAQSYDSRVHDKQSGWKEEYTDYLLVYHRPVLYANCKGKVKSKAWVTNMPQSQEKQLAAVGPADKMSKQSAVMSESRPQAQRCQVDQWTQTDPQEENGVSDVRSRSCSCAVV